MDENSEQCDVFDEEFDAFNQETFAESIGLYNN